jgi:3-deoxy-D-manno-octulosonate 8-phosphate phosphatase (KDO 8-P phosphatase)
MKPLEAGERTRRARRIRLLLSDVDGVLTDAGVYYSARGEELKRFSLRDGMGVELLRKAEIDTGFLSRERSPSVEQRAQKLAISQLFLGVLDKEASLHEIALRTGIAVSEMAYIGDDVNDFGVILRIGECGLTAAPRDALPAVRDAVHVCTDAPGGHGAFREFADLLLQWKR